MANRSSSSSLLIRALLVSSLLFVSSSDALLTPKTATIAKAAQEDGGVSVAKTEEEGEKFMQRINEEVAIESNKASVVSWDYQSNITEETKRKYLEIQNAFADFSKDVWKRVLEWKDVYPSFQNASLKRQFKRYAFIGYEGLPKDKFERYSIITTEMQEVYSKGKICDYTNRTICNLSLEPEIEEILKKSRDYDELTHVWSAWRDTVGRPVKDLYAEFVNLSNEAADINGFASTVEMWTNAYESDTFESDVQALYDQLKPLYQQLHAYARRKLREVYGEEKIPKRGPIPAHVTGNMWAQNWNNIYDILAPYPNKTSVDVTPAMIEQNYTQRLMFEKADDFFASMGLERVPELFWNNSIIKKPEGIELVCHASAWDFYDGKDFRIKQCTNIDMEEFFVVHHEMGHIQYFIQYKHLPNTYREGANPGFHEAVGDVLSLSVSTPKHLQKVGLLQNYVEDDEADINFLLNTALQKVAFLPFGYMIDKYRWEVMRGQIVPQNYTKAWWHHRYTLQGLSPPVDRYEDDFDPAAKYHVSANVRYIRYFVSNILQFQFYKAACLLAKEYDPNDVTKPLHRCDIYQSKEAGKALKAMLQMGASEHWSRALKAMTGGEAMDAAPLREYFKPLEDWLIEDNAKHGEFIGWEGGFEQYIKAGPRPATESAAATDAVAPRDTASEALLGSGNLTEEAADKFLQKINDEASSEHNKYTHIAWQYQTNITDHNKKLWTEAKNSFGAYAKRRWQEMQPWKSSWPNFKNESLKRQFDLYSVLGVSALPEDKLNRLNEITSEMREIYSTAKICDFRNTSKCDLSLEPEIKEIMRTSRDYAELEHVWKAWRDAAGKPTRGLYSEFVQLTNEAAELNGFPSTAEMWMHDYESDTFENDIVQLYEQLRPFYEQLHAYARRKLREVYGEANLPNGGPMPAHVTGNMWAQDWTNIFDILVPYANKTSIDVVDAMINQNYTPTLMFEKADDFFASMGLERVSELFWNNSMLEKPKDREVVCHASAWDFSDGKDFRIKQCTDVTSEQLSTVHHELGHVQYSMQYKHLPYPFRAGANPGFHEAVGDVIDLSVSTPKHLHKIGLLQSVEDDKESDINALMKTALAKVTFLPFAYLMDRYRWDLFRGKIQTNNYTSAWWDYRLKHQGFVPPVDRTEIDFDPAAKSHISSNTRYVRYFVSHVLQFQFHKGLCLLAEEYDPNDVTKPLHRCDIHESLAAGGALRDMLRAGSSVHWSQTLKAIAGTETMDASALLEYFQPLLDWLKADNEQHGEIVGWQA